MKTPQLPPESVMYEALMDRDASFEGLFWVGVRTTGIFCRPTCPARKPKRVNVRFFPTTREALFAGFRPCRRCRPLLPAGEPPEWVGRLMQAVERDPMQRWQDADLREHGFDPLRVRRWFKANHGLTFHAYMRARRLGMALGQLREGGDITNVAYDHGYESLSGFRDAFGQLFGAPPGRGRQRRTLLVDRIPTELGPMLAVASDQTLYLLEFCERRMLETQLKRLRDRLDCVMVPGSNAIIEETAIQLADFLAGRRRSFSVPLEAPGSEFQQSVWEALQSIPRGQTRTYGDIARMIGRPSAVRAVARAVGDNRLGLIIPCHRVVAAGGELGGYAGGTWRKKFLLELEAGGSAASAGGARRRDGTVQATPL